MGSFHFEISQNTLKMDEWSRPSFSLRIKYKYIQHIGLVHNNPNLSSRYGATESVSSKPLTKIQK